MLRKNNFFKFLYIPIILLVLNFLYRLYNQAGMLYYFPIDYNNDGSSYMAQLFFLKVCGFHSVCNYWYNGFVSFLHSPPGWYLFTLPIFNITHIVNVAAYISMILIFGISFFVIYLLFGYIGFSKLQRVAFFIFFFGNAVAVGNFIKLLRVHELFAWLNFLIFFFLIYYFKDRKIDWMYWLVVPAYAFVLLSYQSVGVITSVLFLSLFLVKRGKEKIYVITSAICSLLISAFWWLPAILRFTEGGLSSMQQARWVWIFSGSHLYTNIFIFIVPLVLVFLFYFYIKQSNDRMKDWLFYLPVLILALFFFFRLHPFLPMFGNIFPDPYLVFFTFFAIFLFLKIDFSVFKWNKFLFYFLIFIALVSVSFNVFRTPFFVVPNETLNLELEAVARNIQGNFVILGNFGSKIHSKGLYSYLPTKYNVSTSFGWYPEVKNIEYLNGFYDTIEAGFAEKNCDKLKLGLERYKTTEVLSLDSGCIFLQSCGLNEKVKKGSVCLYSFNGF